MIQNLQEFSFFQRGDCLTWLVVIHEDDLEAWRIKKIALACNAQVMPVFIHNPVIVNFIPQDPVEKIANMPIGRKLWHVGICRVLARRGHHLAHGGIPGPRSQGLSEVFEKAVTIDQAVGFAILIYNRSNTACSAGKRPCHAKLCIWAYASQAQHRWEEQTSELQSRPHLVCRL